MVNFNGLMDQHIKVKNYYNKFMVLYWKDDRRDGECENIDKHGKLTK
jgi:hypothetical protein